MARITAQVMNAKEDKFLAVYLTKFDAEEAAVAVGFPQKSARVVGCQFLTRPTVKVKLQERMRRIAAKSDITLEKVIGELAKLGFSSLLHYTSMDDEGNRVIDFTGATEDQMAAVQEITTTTRTETKEDGSEYKTVQTKLKLHDKVTPLVTLGKHLGLQGKVEKPDGEGDTHYHLHMELPAPASGEDRSYRNGPVIEHRPK